MPALTKKETRKLWNELMIADPDPASETLLQIMGRWEDLRFDALDLLLEKPNLDRKVLLNLLTRRWIMYDDPYAELRERLFAKILAYENVGKAPLLTVALSSSGHASDAVSLLLQKYDLSDHELLAVAKVRQAPLELRKAAFAHIHGHIATSPGLRDSFMESLRLTGTFGFGGDIHLWMARALMKIPPTYRTSQSKKIVRMKEVIAVLRLFPELNEEYWGEIREQVSAQQATRIWLSANFQDLSIYSHSRYEGKLSNEMQVRKKKVIAFRDYLGDFIIDKFPSNKRCLTKLFEDSNNQEVLIRVTGLLLKNSPSKACLLDVIIRVPSCRQDAWGQLKTARPQLAALRKIAHQVPELKEEALSLIPVKKKVQKSLDVTQEPEKTKLPADAIIQKLLGR